MRIAIDSRILVEGQTRGVRRYATNLVRELSQMEGIELVHLLPSFHPYVEAEDPLNGEVHILDAQRERNWLTTVLPRALRDLDVDLFHAMADRGLPVLKTRPLVVTVHDSYERAHRRMLYASRSARRFYWAHEMVNFALADIVLTVSNTTAHELRQLHVARSSQLRVTPLAAAPEFSPTCAGDDAERRGRYGIGQAPYLLFVGGYDVRKNVDALVEAFDRMHSTQPDLVIVAKHQWRYEELRARWAGLQCQPRLRCIEAKTEDLPAIYRGAILCVVPSQWESFCLPLVEAMASGVAVISSSKKALPETGGSAPLYVDASDPRALARALDAVYGDESLREELRRAGLGQAGLFSWAGTAEATVAAYQDAACKRPNAR